MFSALPCYALSHANVEKHQNAEVLSLPHLIETSHLCFIYILDAIKLSLLYFGGKF